LTVRVIRARHLCGSLVANSWRKCLNLGEGSTDDAQRMSNGPQASGGFQARAPRVGVEASVRFRYASFIEFIQTQSVNISRTGMFIVSNEPAPVGSLIEFDFSLTDGYTLLKGLGEVVRTGRDPAGMGVRFTEVEEESRKLLERIAEVNDREGVKPTVAPELTNPVQMAASPARPATESPAVGGVQFDGEHLSVQVSPSTVDFFQSHPLLSIKMGGLFVPVSQEVALGETFAVSIAGLEGKTLYSGKGKVVAKHENRLGVRLVEAEKATISEISQEVAKLGTSPR